MGVVPSKVKPVDLGPDENTTAAEWVALLTAPVPESEQRVPYMFFAGYVTASVVSLGGGVLVGMRSFENSAAMEALDKMEKPTAQAEALAARVAGRAFAWGTAVSIGTAALTVLATRYALQIRSMSDFGDSARSALDPFNTWLERKGEWLQARGEWLESCGQSLGDFGNAIGSAPRRVWHWVSPPIAIEQQTPPALEPPPAPRDENG